MAWTTVAQIGMAVVGGIAGSQKKKSGTKIDVGSPTGLESQGVQLQSDQLKTLTELVNKGPGVESVTQATEAGTNLADMLKRLQETGGMGNASEQAMARTQATQLFAPQQEAMNQSLEQQRIEASRASARMGRQLNDPILQAKLGQERARQTGMIEAQKTQFAAGAGERNVAMASQLFNLRQGIASQALANRQNLFQMGQQATAAERDFRLRSASQSSSSGGGLAGGISGAMAGFGMGGGIASMFGGGGGTPGDGGGGGGSLGNPAMYNGPSGGGFNNGPGYVAPMQKATFAGSSNNFPITMNTAPMASGMYQNSLPPPQNPANFWWTK